MKRISPAAVPVATVRAVECAFAKTVLCGTDDTGIVWADPDQHACPVLWDLGRYRLALPLAPVLTAYSEEAWTPQAPDVYGQPVNAPRAFWELWLVDAAGQDAHLLARDGTKYAWNLDLIALPDITANLHFYGPPLGFLDLGTPGGELRGNGLRLRTKVEHGASATWRLAAPFRLLLIDGAIPVNGT